jgi:hypothetical protein
MMKEYKLTQKQFDWLVDVINSPIEYSTEVRNTSTNLLKAYGFKGWYDSNGKMALQMLTHMVRAEKKQREVDDLPF